MSAHRAVLLALLVVGSSLAVAAPAGAAPVASPDSIGSATAAAPGVQSDPGNESGSSNASLGADISSFMQSSAAEISGAVETGMWTASFNATENESERRELVERRTGELRADLADLRERKAELEAEREAGNLSAAAYRAQIGQLIGRINALRSAINATAPRARQANADVDAVAMLETDVRNLTGPAIASVARNSSGVGVRGPPAGVPGNAGDGGPPAGAGEGGPSDGEGDPGPPEDIGNATTPSDGGPLANATDAETDAPGAGNGNGPDAPGANNGANGNGVGGDASGEGAETEQPGDDTQTELTVPGGLADNRTTEPGPAPNTTAAE